MRPQPAVLALAALLATSASAQIVPTGTPAADILLAQAIADHRVFLTCSALDAPLHQQIVATWQRDVTTAAGVLTANSIPPEAITAFQAAADPKVLMPAEDTPFAQVRQFCDGHADWQKTYAQRDHTVLERALSQAFP
jgi:hypothetical protein